MPQVIGHLFERPSGLTSTMDEIMSQIVEGEVRDEVPFLVVGKLFERAEPVVDAIL